MSELREVAAAKWGESDGIAGKLRVVMASLMVLCMMALLGRPNRCRNCEAEFYGKPDNCPDCGVAFTTRGEIRKLREQIGDSEVLPDEP